MPSKIWSISTELKRSVPLKSRCSRKCEMPACAGVSFREPTPIQNPSAIERTPGTTSVTTRMPESSSDTRCPSLTAPLLPPVACVIGARRPVTPAAVAAAVPTAAIAPTAAAIAPAAARPPAAAALVAGADGRKLLGRLALDLGVVGEPQPDPPALAVDLDHAHRHLVAAVHDVLDGLRPLPWRDVRDVEQA